MSQDYSYLKKISNTFDGEKSLTEILESFRCISKDYNNIKDNPDIEQGTIFRFGKYVCEVDDFNYDAPNESIVFIYKSYEIKFFEVNRYNYNNRKKSKK